MSEVRVRFTRSKNLVGIFVVDISLARKFKSLKNFFQLVVLIV